MPCVREEEAPDLPDPGAMLPALEGVRVRDAVHAAVMLTDGITRVATLDQGFDRIPGVRPVKLD